MFGWRCKIGIIIPIDNAVIEPELSELSGDGISIHGARLHTMELPDMPDDAEIEAEKLGTMGAEVIAYACNASSFYRGPGSDTDLADRLADASGVPTTTASTAMIRALDAVDAESVSVVSPYGDENKQRLREFIEGHGVTVEAITGLGLAPDDPDDLAETNELTAEDTYRRAIAANTDDADAVLVTSTNVGSVRTLNRVEADLDKPAISTNQALYWDALRLAGVSSTTSAFGSLLEGHE
jgi:maleate cis-trans isomerase